MKYDIVFRGKVVSGYAQSEVRDNLARLFRTDAQRIDRLFAGQRTVLKSGLDRATADRYRAALRQAGALVAVVGLRDIASPESEAPRDKPRAGDAPPARRAGPDASPATDAEAAPAAGGPAGSSARMGDPSLRPTPTADDGPGLAEPGALLLAPTRPPAPQYDLSVYTLAEPGAIFDAAPTPPPPPVRVDHLSAELSDEPLDRTSAPAAPRYDLSSFDLGDEDTPLDATPSPAPPAIDTSALEAEPVERPLDAGKRPPPPDIDTSALRLAD